ncbi:phosphonate ABC transporter, permease protein PhnE [Terrarubrum flagellatum]|uniref:phosphonate ABC transporter, permease protein PhnE n=1 Tax=Terrirubrum flagellatum TaxID=2895980 RepID=UPI0031452B06
MSEGLRQSALTDLDGLRARHPQMFEAPLKNGAPTIGVALLLVALFILGVVRLEVTPLQILNGLGQLGTFVQFMLPPMAKSWAQAWLFLQALAETVAIALLGTLLAATFAFPFGFLSARNATINRVVQFISRRFLDSIRGVDTLIWALIWVNVVGLGPFAGVLAIMTADVGSFGKIFSEAIEAADRKPVEGIVASGGSRLHEIRFGLIPQVLPVMLGQILYFFESNTRSATIIGIVGAGGIGLHLSEQIRTLEWQSVSFIVLMILVLVAIIDFLSGQLRFAIIGNRSTAV